MNEQKVHERSKKGIAHRVQSGFHLIVLSKVADKGLRKGSAKNCNTSPRLLLRAPLILKKSLS